MACWCKACLNASSRKYHAANREKNIARHREWLKLNPPDRALMAARTRQWREDNPDQAKLNAKNGKHRRRARTSGQMTAPELRRWAGIQRKVCHWCGTRCEAYEIDHRVPLAKGGRHETRNLVIACQPCNRSKGARDPVEFAQSKGLLV